MLLFAILVIQVLAQGPQVCDETKCSAEMSCCNQKYCHPQPVGTICHDIDVGSGQPYTGQCTAEGVCFFSCNSEACDVKDMDCCDIESCTRKKPTDGSYQIPCNKHTPKPGHCDDHGECMIQCNPRTCTGTCCDATCSPKANATFCSEPHPTIPGFFISGGCTGGHCVPTPDTVCNIEKCGCECRRPQQMDCCNTDPTDPSNWCKPKCMLIDRGACCDLTKCVVNDDTDCAGKNGTCKAGVCKPRPGLPPLPGPDPPGGAPGPPPPFKCDENICIGQCCGARCKPKDDDSECIGWHYNRQFRGICRTGTCEDFLDVYDDSAGLSLDTGHLIQLLVTLGLNAIFMIFQ